MVKIDVEGAELEVLMGADRMIAASRPLLYVENDRAEKSHALLQWLRQHEYRLWWHWPRLYNPANLRSAPASQQDASLCSVNMLCVPFESKITVAGAEEIAEGELHPAMQSGSGCDTMSMRGPVAQLDRAAVS